MTLKNNDMIHFLHNFLPQPILFQLGFLKVYWYGLFIVLGIIVGLIVALKLAKRSNIASEEVYNLGFYLIIFSLLGARVYSVFLDLAFYLQNPFEIIAVWHGGLAIHGAIIGGIITLLVYIRKKQQSFWHWADILAPVIAIGQAIGRFGNYFNQELFGTPTDLAWGIPIALQNRPVEYLSHQYFHPTFLYESLLNLLNFLILIFLFYRKQKKPGLIFFVYLINYSVIRILMEFLRTDQTPEILGIRLPILVSIGIILASIIFIIKKKK